VKELLNIKKLTDDFLKDIEVITTDYKAQQLAETDDELISCCGDELDPDYMICPTCLEHC
jgi:hypothetical protein